MRRLLLFLWVAARLLPAQTPLTLSDAVRAALDRHPDVAKARASAEALQGKVREVRADALPAISIFGGGLRTRDPSLLNSSGLDKFPKDLLDALNPVGANLFHYGVSLKQPLYTAGKVGSALRLAAVQAEGAGAEIDRASQDLALAVVKAWYGLLWADRYRMVVLETQVQRQRHVEMARSRFQHGVATEVDVLRSEVALANIAPDVVRAGAAIRQARSLLNYYMVRPIDTAVLISGDFQDKPWEEPDQEKLVLEAVRRRPEMSRLRIAERSAAVLHQLAQAEGRFRADLNSEYGVMARLPSNLGNSRFARWTLGVNLSLPVFDGFRRSGMVAQATANERSARLERERAEQEIRLNLQQAVDELRATNETILAARATEGQASRVLDMTQNNYKYGAATTLDIVDAQTALSVARVNLLRGRHDYSVARANLLWALGRNPSE
ncbi:MAG: TolC family protein [Acidobacteria bacterium]|nr:TolC family protein [Acidobacteriota bacterium]